MSNMLKILEIRLQIDFKTDDKSVKPLGMIMNEILSAHMDEDYRAQISGQMIKPYTQSIVYQAEDDIYSWKIAALNTQATEKILYVIKDNLPDRIEPAEYGMVLTVQAKNYIHSATYRQLVEKYFGMNCRLKRVDLEFITPTVFFTDEQTILPQNVNLLDNLLYVWNLFAEENILRERNLSANSAEQIYIIDYDFRLKPIQMGDEQLPALTGIYHLGLKANIMTKKIICMLSEYARYCGIGRNTHLGMGCVKPVVFRK